MNTLPEQTDVLVTGLGPVGAALANLLGLYGLSVVVVEKAEEIFKAPRAIALDNEALRVLQMCGLREGDIDTVAIPEVRMHSPVFGQYSRAITAGSLDGHPKLVTFYQPQLEMTLRDKLAAMPHVHVALGVELLSFTQDAEGVEVCLQDRGGRHGRVRARYLVGADGANSLVRRHLGLDFQGKTYAEDWLVVDALNAPQPIDHVEFICDPRRPVPHMIAPGGRQRWEFKLRPGETRERMERPEMVSQLLAPWSAGGALEIERVAVYRFHARVADMFNVGRAFLVGDAAHITPPFVGQGLVAGLRDAANLAWKLAWVAKGQARPEILDSYSQERQPHVRKMINLAKLMGRLVMPGNVLAAFASAGLMKVLGNIPKLRDFFERLEIKPLNRFDKGCFVRRERSARLYRGGQIPQAWVRSRSTGQVVLSDDVLGQGFAMVGYGEDPVQGLSAQQMRQWQALGGQFVRIEPQGRGGLQPSKANVWEDFAGALMPDAVPMGWVAVVRPDKTVMNDGPAERAAAVLEAAMALIVPPSPPTRRQEPRAAVSPAA